MPKKPTHIAADMHSKQEPTSLFSKIKERSKAPQNSEIIFGESNITAIREAGLDWMLWKMVDFNDNEFRWCAFGPAHLRTVLDRYEEHGFADLSLVEYLSKIYNTEK